MNKFSQDTDNVLLIISKMTPAMNRALANLENVSITTADRLNVLQAVQADKILIDLNALKILEDRFNKVKKKSIKNNHECLFNQKTSHYRKIAQLS